MQGETALKNGRRTAFVLSGGGFRGAFEVGALQHLIDDLHIFPDVITSASAGSMFGVILAQARTPREYSRFLEESRLGLMAMTRVDLVFGRQPLLEDLGGTTVADAIQRYLEERSQPDLPGGDPDPESAQAPEPPPAEEDSNGEDDILSRYRRTWEDLTSLVQVIPVVRRARKEGAPPAVLNLDPWEAAVRGKGLIDITPVDPALLARPGLELRMAVTAVRARETRYVCGDGSLVGPDALTPVQASPSDNGTPFTPFDVIDGAIASGSIPGVIPPRRLGDTTYVDGGVLQNVPLAAAVSLGAERIFSLLAVPLADPQKGLSRWAARELGFVSTQQDNLAVELPDGVVNTVIEPTVEVVGSLEVHRGLMAIAIDYGRMRAEEALAALDPGLRPLVSAASDAVAVERARAWKVEMRCLDSGEVSPARLAALRLLKQAVRTAVNARTSLGFTEPAAAESWWSGWEIHSRPVPKSFPQDF